MDGSWSELVDWGGWKLIWQRESVPTCLDALFSAVCYSMPVQHYA